MKYGEAMKAVIRYGKSIRRPGWTRTRRLFYDPTFKGFCRELKNGKIVRMGVVPWAWDQATDWELVENEKETDA